MWFNEYLELDEINYCRNPKFPNGKKDKLGMAEPFEASETIWCFTGDINNQ